MEKSSKNNTRKRSSSQNNQNLKEESGVLEILSNGFGFLRKSINSYAPHDDDVYISKNQIRQFKLKTGDMLSGKVGEPNEKDGERYRAMSKIDSVNNKPLKTKRSTPFDKLKPCFATERILLETTKEEISTRICDLISPVGKGQRGLIIAPPKAGKTVLLKKMAKAMVKNNPEIHLFILLIDERPEEVTDFEESVPEAVVISSTFDQHPKRHIQVTEMTIERAKRLVENGEDVVILMDSITRVARAYNLAEPSSGRTLSGGIDVNALQKPKKVFGAARNTKEDNAGSLTIIATALIETGSKMDDVIFEEFKGTGNMEICLDRKIADARVYPAINIPKSSSRREDLLITPEEMERMWALRSHMNSSNQIDIIKMIIKKIQQTNSNVEFLMSLKVNNESR
jgi:transcription termination factor Rho